MRSTAIKGHGKAARKAAGSDGREALRKIARDGARSTKIAMHNSFTVLIFGLAMALTCMVATEIAFMASGLVIGNAMVTAGDTVSDLIVTFVTVAMVCGFALFFAFKIENVLLAGMRKRLWHTDPLTGEIAKNGNDKPSAAGGEAGK